MLPARSRLRCRADFSDVLRRGRRVGRGNLAMSWLATEGGGSTEPPRIGFVVGGRVGPAVVRNRLRRRLRSLLRERLSQLPPGSRVVVRVIPGAERQSYAELADTVDDLLARVVR